jgi:alpha-glucosidase (family GH31 glycosyl hydrolase)
LLGGGQGCSRFGQDIPNLTVHIDHETESRVRVKITDSDKKRYEIPAFALPDPESSARRNVAKRDYAVKYNKSPFTFSVTRVSTGEVIFDSSVAGMDSLVYEDEYLEISSVLPDDANIYGLGEVVTAFRRDPRGTRQTMWARDAATPVDENLYGSHPFHLEMRKGVAHGVFLRNSNGMDVIITPKKITYKAIGGILDFTIFLGPKPNDVIQQYTELVGRPHMPPAWSLGFHQSRYGYGNIGEVEEVVKRYRQENLPLDGVWIDIDYMDKFKDFTYDETRFPQVRIRQLASDLAAHNQSMVLIIDPGIPILPGYEPYDSGMREDIFIKTLTGKPIEGRVWPGQTYFPDFMNTNETWAYWERQLAKTRADIGDNVYPWIDMNEPANFCSGPCTKDSPGFNPALDNEVSANAFLTNSPEDRDKDIRIASEIEHLARRQDAAAPVNLKYAINNAGRQAPLDEKTLAENAVHKNGLRLTDTHNLYGHTEAMATHHSLLQLNPNQRPFILTRSSFSGTGTSFLSSTCCFNNFNIWSGLFDHVTC